MEKSKKKYGLNTVAQSNKLVEAIHGMTLTEKRLFVHASGLAREQDLKEGEVLTIRADEFARECGIQSHTAYEGLQDAVDRLFNRYFTYVSSAGNPVKCRWVYRLEYKKGLGEIAVSFPAEVILMFTLFNKDNPFTTYDRKHIQQMTSVYSVRLYELFMQYRSIGSRTFELEHIKTMFQLDDKYDRVFNLKARVIDPAIQQINELTDYTVSYEQIKRGRTIHALKFFFEPKKIVIAIKQTKPNVVKKEKYIISWGTSENHLFKELKKKCTGLTKQYIEQLAHSEMKDLSFVLNYMFIQHSRSDFFELKS